MKLDLNFFGTLVDGISAAEVTLADSQKALNEYLRGHVGEVFTFRDVEYRVVGREEKTFFYRPTKNAPRVKTEKPVKVLSSATGVAVPPPVGVPEPEITVADVATAVLSEPVTESPEAEPEISVSVVDEIPESVFRAPASMG